MDEHVWKAFEEVIRTNVQTALDYSKETRRLLRLQEEKIKRLENLILINNAKVEEFTRQLAAVQAKLYVGGTDGD